VIGRNKKTNKKTHVNFVFYICLKLPHLFDGDNSLAYFQNSLIRSVLCNCELIGWRVSDSCGSKLRVSNSKGLRPLPQWQRCILLRSRASSKTMTNGNLANQTWKASSVILMINTRTINKFRLHHLTTTVAHSPFAGQLMHIADMKLSLMGQHISYTSYCSQASSLQTFL
jgi:hypothetical protein